MRWPSGFRSAGACCGIKRSAADLGLLVAERPCPWAGAFTRNRAAAAPVQWSRARLGTGVRAVVVNSGNANACTGREGRLAVERTARATASALGVGAEEVLVASTGPIGVWLPVDRIEAALPDLAGRLTPDAGDFAEAILTTDTATKTSSTSVEGATVAGVAKGAAMLAPNMATMLAFLTTDARVEPVVLQTALSDAVDRSFNRISVDACESTNDSVILLSSGEGEEIAADELSAGVHRVCAELSEQMVRDAEGGTRLVTIRVRGATDDAAAVDLGRAVAASALWRAAVHGADPNWGRVLAALGAVDRPLSLEEVEVSIGAVKVFERGEPHAALQDAASEMKGPELILDCVVGGGPGEATVLSCDLSPAYVELNAHGVT